MKKAILSLLVCIAVMSAMNVVAQNRVIRDVVLLERQPFEVLMTENGDILSKIRHLPDYLKTDEEIQKQVTSNEPLAQKQPEVIDDVVDVKEEKVELVALQPAQRVVPPNNSSQDYKDYFEVEFISGTATLTSKAISTLNELAFVLNSNPQQLVQVFGFQNESPIVALLLSQRRRDACIAYLKIKGVRVSRQIKKGSITKGQNNKIVFGFE